MEMQKQIAIRLNQMAEMSQKSTGQQIQPQPQPLIPNPLPPQPLPNSKGFLNAIHDEVRSEDKSKDMDDEKAEQHLYELLLEMAGSKHRGDADSKGLMDFCEEYDNGYKEDEPDQERETEDEWGKETQSNGEKVLFVNTISDGRKDEEEMPTKCEDLGACLVTCKIRGVDIHECLCDPGACREINDSSRLPYPQANTRRKESETSSATGRPFLRTGGFKQNYHDDTFEFSAGKTTERFQIIQKGKDHSLQRDDGRMRGKGSAHAEMIEALVRGWLEKLKGKENVGQEEKEEELEEKCWMEQKS
ncbi:hypothetical protein PIB30_082469 [Stylosanthes scabra]|uniref:Uncharacterized protein n=1 Tax=Stylosanthes scabra TaxID=79078 RepID=A0ABU6TTE6_9FABA|nr:hypothetical protein [Stylosanthes scabra]